MKIVFESEMEVKLWEILLTAHYKWEKNHGNSIRSQMVWYFFDIFKKDTEEIIAKETDRRLQADHVDIYGKTLEQYIDEGLNNYFGRHITEEEINQLKKDLADEYRFFEKEYEHAKEFLPQEIEDEIRSFYLNFFNAPKDLVIEFDGEIIHQPSVE